MMHIDDLKALCEQEWRKTITLGVKYAKDAMIENPEFDKYEAAEWATECIYNCVDWQDAIAYIVCSGCVFDCVYGTLDYERSPRAAIAGEIADSL